MSGAPLRGPIVRARLDELQQRFEREASTIRAREPALVVRAYGKDVGTQSELQARDVGISVTRDDGEEIVLSVTAAYLTSLPRLHADVSWSHGNIEATTWECESTADWPLATPDTFAHLERDLTRLLGALNTAIDRGRRGRRPDLN